MPGNATAEADFLVARAIDPRGEPVFSAIALRDCLLERSDLAVYWSLCGQLRTRTVELPPGAPIHGVSIDSGSAE